MIIYSKRFFTALFFAIVSFTTYSQASEVTFYDLTKKPKSFFEDAGYILSSEKDLVISLVVRDKETAKVIWLEVKELQAKDIEKFHFAFITDQEAPPQSASPVSIYHLKRKVTETSYRTPRDAKGAIQDLVNAGLRMSSIIQKAEKELKGKNYVEGFQLMKLAAESGNREAQFVIASLYRDGNGVEKSLNEGIKWDHLAAEQQHNLALFRLGRMYIIGKEVPKNSQYGYELLLESAEKGYSKAAYLVAVSLQTGNGVEKDLVQAAHWYLKSIDHDGGELATILGQKFFTGNGVDEDFVLAKRLFEAASTAGNSEATKFLGYIEEYGSWSEMQSYLKEIKNQRIQHKKNIEAIDKALKLLGHKE